MKLINIFPVTVGAFEIERGLTISEIFFIKNLIQKRNKLNHISVDSYVLKSRELSDINFFIEKCLNNYFQHLYQPGPETGIRVTQSWCNYTKPGEGHHAHDHPNSFISGVFYIDSTSEDTISFYKNNNKVWDINSVNINEFNCKYWDFSAKKGTLYIFPSSLAHGVNLVEGNDTRISLSFNSFLTGTLGSEQNFTELLL